MFGLGDLFNATPAIRKTSYLRNLPGWTERALARASLLLRFPCSGSEMKVRPDEIYNCAPLAGGLASF